MRHGLISDRKQSKPKSRVVTSLVLDSPASSLASLIATAGMGPFLPVAAPDMLLTCHTLLAAAAQVFFFVLSHFLLQKLSGGLLKAALGDLVTECPGAKDTLFTFSATFSRTAGEIYANFVSFQGIFKKISSLS